MVGLTCQHRIESQERWDVEKKVWWLRIARRLKFRGGRSSFAQDGVKAVRIDRVLAKAVCKGHAILDRCTDAQGQLHQAPSDARERTLVRLAFLAPSIQAAIFHGSQPAGLNLEGLRFRTLPLAWDDQLRIFEEL